MITECIISFEKNFLILPHAFWLSLSEISFVLSLYVIYHLKFDWNVKFQNYFLLKSTFRLSGLSPFMGDNEGETLSNIMRCSYTFDYPEFEDISSDAKDFIKALLTKNPK